MSIPPGQPDGFQPAGSPAYGSQVQGSAPYQQPPPPQSTSGLAVVGLVLAFLLAPIGFVLSLIAFFTTGRGKKKGRGLAAAGLVLSLVVMGVSGVLYTTVFQNVKTLADPGCTKGKAVLLDNADLGGSTDTSLMKTKLDTLISGLDQAAASARDDDVREAMSALRDDYRQLLQGLRTGQLTTELTTKVAADAKRVDDLCTLGGSED
jgi:hypothetical protein